MADTIETNREWGSHWKDAAARVPAEDFIAQVGYTINGHPIDSTQIDLIADAAFENLAIGASDIVLDLCCGNGLITSRLAAAANHVYGVDFSPSLIAVARRHFARDNITYLCRSVTELNVADFGGTQVTKACMLSALQHFTRWTLRSLVENIRMLAGALVPIYFANIPDVDRLYDFYNTPERRAEYERRRAAGTEAIGTWWNRAQLADLLGELGYKADIIPQNPARFGCHYRFDLLARPR